MRMQVFEDRIDLFLEREIPARAITGELLEWERFRFPLRCLEGVREMVKTLERFPADTRVRLVRKWRRSIQWPSDSESRMDK